MGKIDEIREASIQLYTDIISELSETRGQYDNNTKSFLQLTVWKQQQLPELLVERLEKTNSIWLTKDELVLLMDWKLVNGKFRPTLPKLIQSNDPDTVEDVTKRGYQIWLDFIKKTGKDELWNMHVFKERLKVSIKKLCELRGVGPATASLILSITHRINGYWSPPFFSDESFLYYVKPQGKVKYTVNEYIDELLPVYINLQEKDPSVTMDELERGAWSLKMYELYKNTKLKNLKYPPGSSEEPKKEVKRTRRTVEKDSKSKPKPKSKPKTTKSTAKVIKKTTKTKVKVETTTTTKPTRKLPKSTLAKVSNILKPLRKNISTK